MNKDKKIPQGIRLDSQTKYKLSLCSAIKDLKYNDLLNKLLSKELQELKSNGGY